ncbi:MAG: IMP dehydrogenase [Anaplasmataceae bacterium]|nr:IMP dehydrogenase [Anaplasmataceae bacterium]
MDLALTFDDVLLIPQFSEILPYQANVETYLTKQIKLNIPILSSAMDTVTTSKMAIEIALLGGIGCLHKNCTIEEQQQMANKVKRFKSWIVNDPITIGHDKLVKDVIELQYMHNISGIPVIDKNNKLCGVITNRDIRFIENHNTPLIEVMTPQEKLITVNTEVQPKDALKLLHCNRIERLLVVNNQHQCIGLITVKDIEKFHQYPISCNDNELRLRVGAAIGINDLDRLEALMEVGVDVFFIDTAHGHSKYVIDTVKDFRKRYPTMQIVAGNIATYDAAIALANAGADALKIGIGPGSICTTRIIAGIGYPQLSAIMNVKKACVERDLCLIADGGIRYSGDIAKAIAAGADAVMLGSLLAGSSASPGEIITYKGKAYKKYRGMGSISAMKKGSSARYFQNSSQKLVPEGIEGKIAFKGKTSEVVYQLIGGLKSSMGYTGNEDIQKMKNNCEFVRITNSGLKESHSHDIEIDTEAPNYHIS